MIIALDRDGVISQDEKGYVAAVQGWHPIPGSLSAIARLTQRGHQVVVVTNQTGIGMGLYTLAQMQQVHELLLAQVSELGGKIDKIYYCPHHYDAMCQCRKPNPGMLHQVLLDYSVSVDELCFIGDKYTDWQAGQSVGCSTYLVLTGNGRKTREDHPEIAAECVFSNLKQWVDSRYC